MNENAKVLFKQSHELVIDYEWSDIFLLVVDSNEYRSFAVPYKFYEAIGYGKPILASAGTKVAEIVERENIGWVIENSKESITNFFINISNNEYTEKLKNVLAYRKVNSWEDRCLKVAADMNRVKKLL
jgi:glycosyltransferase involved in cell wall biosynthesis